MNPGLLQKLPFTRGFAPVVASMLCLAAAMSGCGGGAQRVAGGQIADEAPSAEPAAWAHGKDVSERFLKTYAGTFADRDSKRQTASFAADGGFEMIYRARVGVRGSRELPYPTYCWIRAAGRIEHVIERDEGARKAFREYATHVLLLRQSDFRLLDQERGGEQRDPHCDYLIKHQKTQARLPEKPSALQPLFAELLSDDSFRLHRAGTGKPGSSERAPSTLDEIYERAR